MPHVNVVVAPAIYDWLDSLRVNFATFLNRAVTLDEVLNYILAVALMRHERLHEPVLTVVEVREAMNLMAGEGLNYDGFFDYLFPGSEKRYRPEEPEH